MTSVSTQAKTFDLQVWGLPAVLLLAFVLAGAKYPLLFSVWGIAALLYVSVCLAVAAKEIEFHRAASTLILTALIWICWMLSLDRGQSFLWTLEIGVFQCLWIALRAAPDAGSSNKNFALRVALLLIGAASAFVTVWQWARHFFPIYGLLPKNPNFNAALLSTLAVVFLGRCISGKKSGSRLIEGFAALVFAWVAAITGSRSALLSLFVGTLWLAWRRWDKRRVSAAAVIVILSLAASGWLANRLRLEGTSGLRPERLHFWSIALLAAGDHPLKGYGLGNFELAYQRHAFAAEDHGVRFAHTTGFAHNEFLQLIAELGIPTGGMLALFLLGLFRAPSEKLARDHVPFQAGVLTLLVGAAVNPILHVPALVCLLLVLAAPLAAKPKSALPAPRLLAMAVYGYGVFLFLGLVYLGGTARLQERRDWQGVTRWRPWDGEGWHALGFEQNILGPRVAAQREAVRLSPQNVYFQEALARELESSRNLFLAPEMLRHYLEAILLAPRRAIDYLAVGRILYHENDAVNALHWFESARRLEPCYWTADLWIARCYARMGQAPRAMSVLRGLQARHQRFIQTVGRSGALDNYSTEILAYEPTTVDAELRTLKTQWTHRPQ